MSGTVWNQYSALQRWRGGYFAHALSVLLALSSAVQRWTMGPRSSDVAPWIFKISCHFYPVRIWPFGGLSGGL
ncbi:hypothetical protein DFH05DRAFT_1470255 [Lentinula detonsa]|uniref:Uncharacterized protein n=1 Tax=Lentinula detonsa TaxID=2804962 RepID=A0A9W8PC71_9AGAR|nr:hypothetical protein DFH05DRAFT_1470255 [Lentinula detonsa]